MGEIVNQVILQISVFLIVIFVGLMVGDWADGIRSRRRDLEQLGREVKDLQRQVRGLESEIQVMRYASRRYSA